MCFNKKVVAGLAVAAIAVAIVAPSWIGATLPLLILAACPLSMIVMMRFMSGQQPPNDASSHVEAELASLRSELAQLRNESTAAGDSPTQAPGWAPEPVSAET